MGLAEHAAAGVDQLRRVMAVRAMLTAGSTTGQVAAQLRLPLQEVDRFLAEAPDLDAIHPAELVRAAAPVLRALAEIHDYGRLAVFGSVARGEAGPTSDIDLLVRPPVGSSTFDLLRFKKVLEQVLGRCVDLVSYGSLKPGVDQDILRDARVL